MAARAGNPSLTEEELAGLQTALAEGRRATVYLREPIPTLDLAAGSSARVVSIVGGSLMVKPRGIDDELSFEADELRLTRRAPEPPAKKASAKKAAAAKKAPAKKTAPAKPAKKTAAKAPAAPAASAPATVSTGGSPRPAAPAQKSAAAQKSAPAKTAATKSAAAKTAPAKTAAAAAEPAAKKSAAATRPASPAAGQSAGRRRPPATVSVVIEGDVEAGWTVSVQRGARRVAKPVEVGPQEVLAALRELGDRTAIDEAETLMAAARAQAAQRVDALAAELERARRELDELGSLE